MASHPRVEFENISVMFGSNQALKDVSLTIRAGEIIGLVGANGAGKSTLGRVLVGELPWGNYKGQLRVNGAERRFTNTRAAHEAGVVLIHQEGAAVGQLSVGENVMLAIEPARYGWIDWNALHGQAREALDRVAVAVDTERPISEQGGIALFGLVETARAIARGSEVFVFDESTAALGADEIKMLLERLRELALSGAAVVFISHRIDEILDICNRVVVLRDGGVAMDRPRDGLDHGTIVRHMLGPSFSNYIDRAAAPTDARVAESAGQPRLRLSDWRVPAHAKSPAVGPIDLSVAPGEIMGVFGPLGAGKTELLRSIFGLAPIEPMGRMQLGEQTVPPFRNARDAIRGGVAYVSADRQKDGLVPQLSVLENMMLGHHSPQLSDAGGVLRHKKRLELCEALIAQVGVRTTGSDQPISRLSGGNQQKVLLARALINAPRLLLLDEPTRGIDIGAKEDVYALIRTVAAGGTSIVVASMEESEILTLADRILVLRNGLQLTILDRAGADENHLMILAAGGETE